VPVVDTQVADALLRTARAARLLGAQIVLTGIGSHIAQTLITVGADLSGLVTLNNLQSGISYAMQLMNGSSATASAGAPAK
jgi:rsbT co-antagonist protein RsbR